MFMDQVATLAMDTVAAETDVQVQKQKWRLHTGANAQYMGGLGANKSTPALFPVNHQVHMRHVCCIRICAADLSSLCPSFSLCLCAFVSLLLTPSTLSLSLSLSVCVSLSVSHTHTHTHTGAPRAGAGQEEG